MYVCAYVLFLVSRFSFLHPRFSSCRNFEKMNIGISCVVFYSVPILFCFAGRYFRNFQFEDMQELKPELIRSRLYKAYLEDFFDFCTNQCGSTTGEVMRNVLSVRGLCCTGSFFFDHGTFLRSPLPSPFFRFCGIDFYLLYPIEIILVTSVILFSV